MGIDLWFSSRFFAQRPPIFKDKVLDFKSIKVTCFPGKKSGFLGHMDLEFGFKSLNSSPGYNFEATGTKLGSNVHLSKLLLNA